MERRSNEGTFHSLQRMNLLLTDTTRMQNWILQQKSQKRLLPGSHLYSGLGSKIDPTNKSEKSKEKLTFSRPDPKSVFMIQIFASPFRNTQVRIHPTPSTMLTWKLTSSPTEFRCNVSFGENILEYRDQNTSRNKIRMNNSFELIIFVRNWIWPVIQCMLWCCLKQSKQKPTKKYWWKLNRKCVFDHISSTKRQQQFKFGHNRNEFRKLT